MNPNNPVQPIFILPEGTNRTKGKDAQRLNIEAAKIVAGAVRTTLGPKGMDKMIVDAVGEVIVTNDGVTILEEMQIEHPAGKMMVEIAKTQEKEIGDGTTTAVVLAGELLKKAEDMLDRNIHPTIIAKGYRLATEKAFEILNNISEDIKISDDKTLRNIAITAMTGKGSEHAKEYLADLVVKAIKFVTDQEDGNKISVNKENIKIEKTTGDSVEHTELIQGIVLDKEKPHPSMPYLVKNAKIALINSPIEVKSTETDAKIEINDPNQLNAFLTQEENMLKQMVTKIKQSGATVVFCQKGIDDMAQHFLAKEDILAVRRVKKSDMEKLSRATGAKIVTHLDDLKKEDLGMAGLVQEKIVGDEKMIFVEQCKHPKAVTLLIRGGTEHVIYEIKRAVEDAIGDVSSVVKGGKGVGGAGSCEVELIKELKKYSDKLSGREQIAARGFAEALEIIPKTLAENSGMDPIDILVKMSSAHEKGDKWAGIDVFTGKIIPAWKNGIIEPLQIKIQAISSAAEVANLILRIDDVIVTQPMQQSNQNHGEGIDM